ncbi:MAG: hypothetical protein AB7U85_07110 [Alphaproteobacteria bacterium]
MSKRKDSAEARFLAFKSRGVAGEFLSGAKNILKKAQEDNKSLEPQDLSKTNLVAVVRKYFPDFWNSSECGIRWNNNCYSYACNDPFGHKGKPQPGEKAGHCCENMTIADVTRASIKDGLVKAELDKKGNPIPKDGCYVVALVVAEDYDYHWYRQDENGKWTHKMGSSDTFDVDAGGQVITDPRYCNRGLYDQFGGFFYVPNNGIRIGEKARRYKKATFEDDYKRHLDKLDEKSRKKLSKVVEKCGVFVDKKNIANQNSSFINMVNRGKSR